MQRKGRKEHGAVVGVHGIMEGAPSGVMMINELVCPCADWNYNQTTMNTSKNRCKGSRMSGGWEMKSDSSPERHQFLKMKKVKEKRSVIIRVMVARRWAHTPHEWLKNPKTWKRMRRSCRQWKGNCLSTDKSDWTAYVSFFSDFDAKIDGKLNKVTSEKETWYFKIKICDLQKFEKETAFLSTPFPFCYSARTNVSSVSLPFSAN